MDGQAAGSMRMSPSRKTPRTGGPDAGPLGRAEEGVGERCPSGLHDVQEVDQWRRPLGGARPGRLDRGRRERRHPGRRSTAVHGLAVPDPHLRQLEPPRTGHASPPRPPPPRTVPRGPMKEGDALDVRQVPGLVRPAGGARPRPAAGGRPPRPRCTRARPAPRRCARRAWGRGGRARPAWPRSAGPAAAPVPAPIHGRSCSTSTVVVLHLRVEVHVSRPGG